jgi:hypothetical protein
MRHILLITAFVITFLVPSLAFAVNGDTRSAEDREASQQAGMRMMEQRAFKKAYDNLGDANQATFKEIVTSAVGEDMMSINQTQLVGFMSFIKDNSTASCNVINASKEDMKSAYRLTNFQRQQYFAGFNSMNNQIGVSEVNPALMCTAGDNKKLFTGLPASTLNKFYNSNVNLASETITAPVVVTTTPTTPTTTASITPTQPVTGYGNYMSQSLADNQGAAVQNTAFSNQSVQAKPASDESMHFSSGASGASH